MILVSDPCVKYTCTSDNNPRMLSGVKGVKISAMSYDLFDGVSDSAEKVVSFSELGRMEVGETVTVKPRGFGLMVAEELKVTSVKLDAVVFDVKRTEYNATGGEGISRTYSVTLFDDELALISYEDEG